MAYSTETRKGKKNRHGITDIRPGDRDNLVLHWDYDTNPKNHYPVLFYTPDMNNTDTHYHIQLNLIQAKKMHKWLSAFIKNKKRKKK